MNQKLENLLNLALETPEAIRTKTGNLNVGFNEESKTWELIVKYHGSLERLELLDIKIEYLLAGYAILTMQEQLVNYIAELEEIEYVEKPKRYYYNIGEAKADSCILPMTLREPYLSGEGCLIAVIDSGIDYKKEDFRYADGTTRIAYLWDQTLIPGTTESGNGTPVNMPPSGFIVGVEFDREQINAALAAPNDREMYSLVPSRDISGHGTAIAGIAAGVGINTRGGYAGVATGAEYIIVKLGVPDELGFPRTTEIMRAITYAVTKGVEMKKPLVINLSFGNSYGAHDGSSLLERFIDNAAEVGRTVICIGSGNEGNSAGHIAANIADKQVVELAVGEYEMSLSIQLWKDYSDQFRIFLSSPGGIKQEFPAYSKTGKFTFRMEQTEVLAYLGEPTPYSADQEIYMELIPSSGKYINSGVWQIILEPVEVVTGRYFLYLPSQAARSTRTVFYTPTMGATLTIPSTASKVITVGAYDSTYDSYADFSGRGYVDARSTLGVTAAGMTKPDIVAPGVNIIAPSIFGGYQSFTGTSFATPIVAGCAALLMQWGIVMGNDQYLYGEKVKAYLRSGARPIRGEVEYPNAKTGWGALCFADSFPY